MDNVKIRNITMSEQDINGMLQIHRNCEDPWNEIEECKSWISKRIERGFYLRLAEVDENIVGHAEWIISDEPDRKFLYLGMLQIDADYQRKGIGRLMINDGIEYAKKNSCSSLVTSPDMEENADIFYRKCGFKNGRKQYLLHILTEPYKDYEFEKTNLDKVPFSTIKEKKFIFGKGGQFSVRHMWEVMNEKPSTDTERRTPAILLSDGTYIQICHWGKDDDIGFTLVWSNNTNYSDIIKSALSFGYSIGLTALEFNYLEDEESFIDGFDICNKRASGDFEQIYYID